VTDTNVFQLSQPGTFTDPLTKVLQERETDKNEEMQCHQDPFSMWPKFNAAISLSIFGLAMSRLGPGLVDAQSDVDGGRQQRKIAMDQMRRQRDHLESALSVVIASLAGDLICPLSGGPTDWYG
jgi:hypothetical protein